jgi:hypothetical protein
MSKNRPSVKVVLGSLEWQHCGQNNHQLLSGYSFYDMIGETALSQRRSSWIYRDI